MHLLAILCLCIPAKLDSVILKIAMEWFAGSAERPAHRADGRLQPAPQLVTSEYMTGHNLPPPDTVTRSAARPANHSEFYKGGFYNIGWNKNSNKPWHTTECLAAEICDLVCAKRFDWVGIGEVFNLQDDCNR